MIHPKLLPIVFILLMGCTQSHNQSNRTDTISVDAEQAGAVILSKVFGDISFTCLKNDGVPIGEISALKTYKNRSYIFDAKSNAIYCFNNASGKHEFSIKASGRGPEEILFITGFLINEQKETIEIIDSDNRKILKFSLTGDFLAEQQTGFLGHYFEVLDSSTYIIYANYQKNDFNSNLYLTNARFEPQKSLLPILERFKNLSQLYFVHFKRLNNGHVLFSEMHDNKIYEVQQDSLYVRYTIDFMSNNIPESLKQTLDQDQSPPTQMDYLNTLSESNYCYDIHSFFESDELIGFLFTHKKQQNIYLKNTTTSKSILIDNILLDNKMDLPGRTILLDEDYIYIAVNGLDLVKYKKLLLERFTPREIEAQNSESSYLLNLYKISDNAAMDDNPCIIKMKITL
jgi:hypothetical protein